eukprot:scaffold23107_cov159-Isochrysis_galbana.AAC.2
MPHEGVGIGPSDRKRTESEHFSALARSAREKVPSVIVSYRPRSDDRYVGGQVCRLRRVFELLRRAVKDFLPEAPQFLRLLLLLELAQVLAAACPCTRSCMLSSTGSRVPAESSKRGAAPTKAAKNGNLDLRKELFPLHFIVFKQCASHLHHEAMRRTWSSSDPPPSSPTSTQALRPARAPWRSVPPPSTSRCGSRRRVAGASAGRRCTGPSGGPPPPRARSASLAP